jgi:hypothetical protein
MTRRTLIALIVALLVAGVALPAHTARAQSEVTVTISEADITAEALKRAKARSNLVEDIVVDLRPGQVVIDYKGKTNRGDSLAISGVFDVAFANGRLTWKLASATLNGVALNAATLRLAENTIRGPVQDGINRALRSELGSRYTLKAVEITDTELIVTAVKR